MKDKKHKIKTAEVICITQNREHDVSVPAHFRMLPLDNRKVTQLFTAHDRYREILRAV